MEQAVTAEWLAHRCGHVLIDERVVLVVILLVGVVAVFEGCTVMVGTLVGDE